MTTVYLCIVEKATRQAPKGIDVPLAFGSKADRDSFLATARPLGWHARSISDAEITDPEGALAILAEKLPEPAQAS